jgi:ribosome-associated protein YbcJ (S4-like RNA binding protein)
MIVLIFDKKLLIDLGSLLKVTSQIMKGSHAKLVFYRVSESAVIVHDFIFITDFLGQLEKKSVL